MQVIELLEREELRYKTAGKDILVHCLNPEHEDNNPSMRIDKLTGLFNCLSCGFHGNIFTHYNESVDTLGIKILSLKKKISGIIKNELLLPLGKEVFARKHRNISGETYKYFNAFTHDSYDGRIVFPIHDITGKLLALIGRYAFSDASPKYLIDPPHVELPLFPPDPTIYRDSIVLVEGVFDVLNLWDKGLTNVVCTFGKSLGETKKRSRRVTNLQKFIPYKIQGVKKIYILYDMGANRSANRLKDLLDELFIVEVIEYPGFTKDKDAGDLKEHEVKELREYIYE